MFLHIWFFILFSDFFKWKIKLIWTQKEVYMFPFARLKFFKINYKNIWSSVHLGKIRDRYLTISIKNFQACSNWVIFRFSLRRHFKWGRYLIILLKRKKLSLISLLFTSFSRIFFSDFTEKFIAQHELVALRLINLNL
jgi:hypothetical protein